MNADAFLARYRVLEGILEKRYEGEKLSSSSVVIEYLHDIDSLPVRSELDLLREIRNILSHNAGQDGEPVVEPSDEIMARLDGVIEYVKRARRAADFGTPAAQIFSASPNDFALSVMRGMSNKGFSHVPVMEKGNMTGVFSARGVFEYLSDAGLTDVSDELRVRDLGGHIRFDAQAGERYEFVAADSSVIAVRRLFQRHSERNRRLSVVFVTENGEPGGKLISMLTPWDVLSDQQGQ